MIPMEELLCRLETSLDKVCLANQDEQTYVGKGEPKTGLPVEGTLCLVFPFQHNSGNIRCLLVRSLSWP